MLYLQKVLLIHLKRFAFHTIYELKLPLCVTFKGLKLLRHDKFHEIYMHYSGGGGSRGGDGDDDLGSESLLSEEPQCP